jgi:hypothetical protein
VCLWCRYKNKNKNGDENENESENENEGESSQNSKRIYNKSNIYCSICDVALCINNLRNCFYDFHLQKD